MTKQEFLAMSLSKGLVLQSPYGFKPNGKESTGIFRLVHLTGDLYADIENKIFPEEFIPILRPLPDLTKPIEHKGEKFVPIDRFLEDIVREWNMCNINYPSDAKGLYGDIIKNITSCEFWIIQKLIEWHFNLMDVGEEFIDVNTLEENPYK